MHLDDQQEREIRAGRNQALFRIVNEKMKGPNEAFQEVTGTYAIACECADLACIETLLISPAEYEAVRAEPRRFTVRPGHVYPEVETVIEEADSYVVVEKLGSAADVVERLVPQTQGKENP
jgi:5-bromo-4-chloroindolyl phosphate hydrolysis protein